ncbi:MAG TPA: preprotein translocase subunit SecA [Leptospiraceae bacterium]|nr:preprotein translocase subunit SecA [Leptospiraceae bacterium]HMW07745.1 preprotein translocase subunit SecA [Leptospiraceae bacterium]HMX31985.1 preprotein translocase subunit SecA [Leptospiraceae bacterium]HMY33411.1 preprotein translocase subunit SecA [Leptospiraceae bacterium]HMZ64781.1 preprotein translocase subunit SecA [Leptospiraceae bacterium]
MFQKVLQFIFGSKYERDLKRLTPIVAQINALEPEIQKLSNDELKNQTQKFKNLLASGKTLDDILPEAFATIREVSVRTMGLRHYDVQMMGGIALHWGNIAEMKTGEGKTLTSTLAVYLNSLAGKGVHVVTVNDYLARRDALWMKPIYDFLGVTVGIIQHDMEHEERQLAYGSDITYGTNNEYGFDYLRDNMVPRKEHKVQREHFFAIVDEVDSILIDEARTPLIISGAADESTDNYIKIDTIIPKLVEKDDYEVDEKARNVLLTEAGVKKVEQIIGVDNLYSPDNVELVHHVHQALKAHKIFQRDVDYVVQNGEVLIVDEFTGRLMPGRRYSDGLHQALEAKEKVTIARESQTLASITFQNYFRIYEKLSGMTGTADTEAEEFAKIYKLDVIVIPPNIKMKRIDHPDRVYRTEREKFNAIINEIKELHAKKQPVLVGTISIEKSELLSNRLRMAGLPHNVLNAKFHEKEAEIIANAGKPGAITIATNMAGRGTDIVLGGAQKFKDLMEKWTEVDPQIDEFKLAIKKKDYDTAKQIAESFSQHGKKKKAKEIIDEVLIWEKAHEEVLNNGGLHILGTERHEARRIDNQLRGRSGRQGDPGSSRFYLSLEDDLMRIFGSDRISSIMQRLGMEEGQEIEHKMVSNAIARSQKRVEGHNFDIRKHLLEYDDVMNAQRIFIYNLRNDVLNEKANMEELIQDWVKEVVDLQIEAHCQGKNPAAWDYISMNEWLTTMNVSVRIQDGEFSRSSEVQERLREKLVTEFVNVYKGKISKVGKEVWQYLERSILLDILDHRWKEHLYVMDHLRDGIWTVGYGEKNPLVEYKIQGFKIFATMVDNLKAEVIGFLMKVEVAEDTKIEEKEIEYRKVGEESTDIDLFNMNGNRNDLIQTTNKRKIDTNVTSGSSGGSSSRKSSRRKR